MAYKFRMPGGPTTANSSPTPATRWVMGLSNSRVGYAPNSDRTSWTWYDSVAGSGNPDALDVAYGKDGSGNGIYVMSRDVGANELFVSSTDITDGSDWTTVDLPDGNNKPYSIAWSTDSTNSNSGVWFAVGDQGNEKIYRSTNGAVAWSAIDLSGLTGHVDNVSISQIASNGSGHWAFGQGDRFYLSTNDGASFSVSTPFTADRILGIAYTNSSWVVAYERSNLMYARSCAGSDTTTWSSEVAIDGNGGNVPVPTSSLGSRCTIVASEGNVAFMSHGTGNSNGRIGHCDINGATISNMETVRLANSLGSDGPKDMATDGTTWLIGTIDGDTWESTDNAASWTKTADASFNSTADILCVTPNIHLPI